MTSTFDEPKWKSCVNQNLQHNWQTVKLTWTEEVYQAFQAFPASPSEAFIIGATIVTET